MGVNAKVLVPSKAILGEGAWYDWKKDRLIWLDIFGKEIHVFDSTTQKDTVYPVPIPVTTIVPAAHGFLLGTTQGVMQIDDAFQNMRPYLTPDYDYSAYRCNDGKCGPDGRFWIGIMELDGKPGQGALYAVDGKSCQKMLDKLDVPNGIVWDEQRGKMYFTDTLNATVFAYDYRNGLVSNPTPVFHAETGMTDGMTIDENGCLWIAVWGTGTVFHVDPVRKQVLSTVETTAPQVSSVALHNGKLYITSATSDMTKEAMEEYPDSGSLFVADVSVNGLEAYRYLF